MSPPIIPSVTPPVTPPKRLVLAVVPDLFFAVRVSATARHVSVPLELVPPPRAVARAAQAGAVLLIVDLHAPGAVALVAELKRAQPDLPIVGFYSHVETTLRRTALEAGADAALPRSAFVARLPDLLQYGLDGLTPRPELEEEAVAEVEEEME
jgi:DNA-binding NarL/FixJ family response regulator